MLRIGSGHTIGLGDLLILTPVCYAARCIVELPFEANNKGFIFENIAKIEYKEDPIITGEPGPNCSYIQDKLLKIGVESPYGGYVFPKIILKNEKLKNQSFEILYGIKKPIVLKINCTYLSQYYKNDYIYDIWQQLVDKYKDQYSFIQFGQTSNFTPLNNTIKMLDLDLEFQAYLYCLIGRYIGVDTGDHHLMLSVGGGEHSIMPAK